MGERRDGSFVFTPGSSSSFLHPEGAFTGLRRAAKPPGSPTLYSVQGAGSGTGSPS